MTPKVKICGLTRAEDVACAIGYGAAFLGFIVEATSPRKLSVAKAARLARPAKTLAQIVAVTVNADDRLLEAIIRDMQPDYIQCHGDESPERVAEISRCFGVKAIKALPVSTPSDMQTAAEYSGVADFILYDAKPPAGETVRGGHGLSFDWQLLRSSPLPHFWALAGGLTPENVTQAIARTNAPMLDVSSGVEASPGIKDEAKIKAFMKAAHNG